MNWKVDEPVRKPVPPKKKPVPPPVVRPRPISPDVEIFEETKPLVREPSPPPPPPPKPIPKPVIKPVPPKEEPPKKEPPPPTMPEGPSTYVEENQVTFDRNLNIFIIFSSSFWVRNFVTATRNNGRRAEF